MLLTGKKKRAPSKRPRPAHKKGWWNVIKRWGRYLYLRTVRQNSSPARIATGTAVGVFLGIFPTFGLGIPVALGLAYLFRFNAISAVIGSTIMNPLTTPFFWTASALLGGAIFGEDVQHLWSLIRSGAAKEAIITSTGAYLVGNTIIAITCAGIFWVLSYLAVLGFRRARGR
jgi:uncharacterized protein (DUF2062 family)